jgi:RNA polymerase sigma factor (sigma-70 family)
MSRRIGQRGGAGAEVDRVVADIEWVYRRRLGDFRSMVAAMLRDRDAAHDVVQDAFAAAVRQAASYRGVGSLEAWICRIVINAAQTERRRRFAQAVAEPVCEWTAAALPDSPEESDVQVALARLPERQRPALFLRYYVDLDYRTIAAVLDVAPGTVSATLHSAHAALRRTLEGVVE